MLIGKLKLFLFLFLNLEADVAFIKCQIIFLIFFKILFRKQNTIMFLTLSQILNHHHLNSHDWS